MDLYHFFEHKVPEIIRSISHSLPENVVFAFVLEGQTGGAWQVNRCGGSIWVGPLNDDPKDCELHCSSEVFYAIVSGTLNPRRAFLDGRLLLLGDIGLALCLQDVLAA